MARGKIGARAWAAACCAVLIGGAGLVGCSGGPEPNAAAPAPEPKPTPATATPAAAAAPQTSSSASSGAPDDVAVRAAVKPPLVRIEPPASERESDEVFAALVSVNFHATYGLPTATEREHVEIPPLRDAAKKIARSSDARARALALTKLYAIDPGIAQRLGSARNEALEIIDAPLRKKLDQKFANPTGMKDLESRRVAEYIDSALHVAKSSCGATKPESVVTIDPNRVIEVTTTLSVAKSVDSLRAVVDPQNWDCCGAEYFSQACVPEYDASGNVTTTSDGITPKCKVGNLPSPGSKWKDPLYERFRVAIWGFDVVFFRTIVDIDVPSQPGDPDHHLAFSLNQSRGGAIGFWKGKVDYDSGGVVLTKGTNGRVQVKAKKAVRFEFGSDVANAIWTKLGAATLPIAAATLEEGICCKVGQCKQP